MPGKIEIKDIEVTKKSDFEITVSEEILEAKKIEIKKDKKVLKAKCFYNGAKLPATAEEFKKGLEEGLILFAKKGLLIESHISKWEAKPGNGECCYAIFSRKAYANFFVKRYKLLSSVPFEWQKN